MGYCWEASYWLRSVLPRWLGNTERWNKRPATSWGVAAPC
jgi:hypothetical protein